MKNRLGWFVGLMLGITLCGAGIDDTDPVKTIVTKLAEWFEKNPQEKLYLHLDKPFYAIGDDLWFKVYAVTGEDHKLSAISKVVYVDLINEKDSIKQTLKLPMNAGLAWGDFRLTDSLAEGNYRIRAYTNWMRNFDNHYFFDKTFRIANSITNKVFASARFSYSGTENNQKVSAKITYADLNGKPYANRSVSYDVQLDSRSVTRGRGTTDAAGTLEIRFENRQPFVLKSGRIITSLKLDDKIVVNKTIPVKSTNDKVAVQFFPEGGTLVNNVRSRVAFKAVGADGLGVEMKGVIQDNTGAEVATFSTQHLGMGVLSFSPLEGKTYKAAITFPDGSTRSESLPAASQNGFSLAVFERDAQNLLIRITPSASALKDSSNRVVLVAQSGGKVYYAAKSGVDKNSFSAAVAKSRFPSGIVQFTLFNGKGEPLNERIVFIDKPDKLNASIKTDKDAYQPKEKTRMSIEVKDPAGKPVQGSFSLSVTDAGLVPPDGSEGNILTSLLLTSDIRGYIENPNYYFENISDKTRSDLDVLMLTQGYRRFEWRQVMNNIPPVLSFQPEKGLQISGRVTTTGSKPVPKGKVTLFATAGGATVIDTLTDAQGRFRFDNIIFADSTKFVIQARTEKNRKNVDIELDGVPAQLVTRNPNTGDVTLKLSDAQLAYAKNSKKQYDDLRKYGLVNKSIVLGEVKITDKKNPVKNSANLNGAGNADQVIRADQLMQGCFNLVQCLQGRLVGVLFYGNRAYSTRSGGRAPMEVFLDGVPVGADGLDLVNPNDVATIEVLRSGANLAIYGLRGGNGILMITTKRGEPNYNYQRYAPGILSVNPKGFAKIREFYTPNYDNPKTNMKVADLRSTLYWNPKIITDANGKASFQYFNADGKGKMRAVLEGIDLNGHLAHSVLEYQVN